MTFFTEEDPTQRRYVDLITEVTAFEATKEPMKIISASDMLGICDAFLAETQCHIEDRLPLSIAGRRELGRKIEWNCPHSWKPREEWSTHVRHALQILNRRYLDTQYLHWMTGRPGKNYRQIFMCRLAVLGRLLSFIALEIPGIYRCRLSFLLFPKFFQNL